MQGIIAVDEIRWVLKNTKSIAIVGLSPKENRPSNLVGRYLIDVGYAVVPVNPGHTEILGKKCYSKLIDIKEQIDVVDIFRKTENVMPVVEEAITIGAKVIWMQLGIVNYQAATRAEQAGLTVIMDRCIKIEHSNLFQK
jgi:uncharacterized protein